MILNDLSDLDELEECKLRWCHKTVHVFIYVIPNLKNAYVSHLKSLTHFCSRYSDYDFNSLKHLVLEDCPRLEGVVPRDCELRSLVTLDILFCYNLKAIFYDRGYSSPGAATAGASPRGQPHADGARVGGAPRPRLLQLAPPPALQPTRRPP
jgi:hypothetical protein